MSPCCRSPDWSIDHVTRQLLSFSDVIVTADRLLKNKAVRPVSLLGACLKNQRLVITNVWVSFVSRGQLITGG